MSQILVSQIPSAHGNQNRGNFHNQSSNQKQQSLNLLNQGGQFSNPKTLSSQLNQIKAKNEQLSQQSSIQTSQKQQQQLLQLQQQQYSGQTQKNGPNISSKANFNSQLPVDDGSNFRSQQQLLASANKGKGQNSALMMQLQGVDQEIRNSKAPAQRYDVNTNALQKKKSTFVDQNKQSQVSQEEMDFDEQPRLPIQKNNDKGKRQKGRKQGLSEQKKRESDQSGFTYSFKNNENNQSLKDRANDLNQSSVSLLKSEKKSLRKSQILDMQNKSLWAKIKQCCLRCRGKGGQAQEIKNENEYSSGESDTEFETPFSELTFQEKQDRVKYLWHRTVLKAKGAAHILAKFGELNKKIYLYGAARKGEEPEDPNAIMIKNRKCIILPDDKYKAYWNLIITCLLLYTASFVPFRIAFVDDNPTEMIVFDTIVDSIFLTDCILNFFSALEDPKVGIEVRHAKIATVYLKSWFVIDIMSCFPMQLLELYLQSSQSGGSKKSQTSSVKLLRLTRLPRLYRLVRLLRIFKMLRLFKSNGQMRRLMDAIKMNAGIMRMISVTITVFFLVHLVGCIWFLSAKLDDFNPDTWVVRFGYLDYDSGAQYLASIYWALQTLTTVGFGDISAKTIAEKIIAILWMIFGVGFYSFTIGNLSQIIASIDTQSAILSQKLSILQEFAKRTNLPNDVMFRIRRHLENNNKHQNNLEEQEKLLNDLPAALRSEVLKHTHGEIIQKINFFRDKDPDFLWAILPALRPIKLLPTDVLYTQGDHSDEIYFIKKGRIKLYIDVNENNPDASEPLNIAFIAYVEGSYFGDSDIQFQQFPQVYDQGENKDDSNLALSVTQPNQLALKVEDSSKGRDSTAVADTECHLLVLNRKDLMALGEDFEIISHEMREIANERKKNHERLIAEALSEHYQSLKIMAQARGEEYTLPKYTSPQNILKQRSPGAGSPIINGRQDMNTTNNNGGSGGQPRSGMFSDAVSRLNTGGRQQASVPAAQHSKLQQKESQVESNRKDLEEKQKRFREDYNQTLVNFQNNMNFLSIHADEINGLFSKYQDQRQKIMGAMGSMRDQAQLLKNNSDILKGTLDMIVENINQKDNVQ